MLHAFNPKRSLGQNFLVNPRILDKIVSAAEISKDDIILEVGPGTGLLTKKLAEKAGKVLAVEKDHRFIKPLQETFRDYSNVEIIESDIMSDKLPFLQGPPLQPLQKYKIVANIPYYITSNFLRKVLEEWPRPSVEDPRFGKTESGPQPKLIVLTIQKEVAQRIMAKPPPKSGKAASGQARMNLLALSVQYYSEPEIVGYVSKNNFRPVPKVDSAIIRLKPKTQIADREQTEEMFKLIRAGFSEKRKQLPGNIASKLGISKEKILTALTKLGLKPDVRAENLSLEEWHHLHSLLRKSSLP